MSFQSPKLSPLSVPGPNSGGLLGFLSDLVGGIHGANTQNLEYQNNKQRMQLDKSYADMQKQNYERQNKQTDLLIQKSAIENATAQRNQIMGQIFSNPKYASDPIYVKKIQDLNNTLGLPTPMTDKGALDISSYQQEFTSLPQAQQKMMLELPRDQRKPLLDSLKRQGYNISTDLYKTNEFVDAKSQAALQNARLRSTHEQHWNRIQESSLEIRRDRAAALDAGDAAKVRQIDARVQVYNAQAGAIPARLALEARRVANDTQRLQLATQRFQSNPGTGRSGLTSALNGIMTNYTRASGELASAQKQYETVLANTTDPDDDQVKAAKQTIDMLQENLDQLKTLHDQAIHGLQSGISGAGTLSASSGMSVTPVPSQKSLGRAPSGVPRGDYIVRGRRVHVDSQGNMSAL